jgi:hypothetical protein
LTPEQARALLAAPELLAQASADDLRVAEKLRGRWPAALVAAACEQAELRQRARAKVSDPSDLLLTRAGLEQASTEPVAQHRAQRFAGADGPVVDLCCGIGLDLRSLAGVAHVVGVDRDETAAVCAAHNSAAPTVVADVRGTRLQHVAAAYVDPARRDGDRRGGYEPPLSWCLSLPVDRVAVKVAPGIDLATLPSGWEVEFVADRRALKEACLWSPAWATADRRATVITATGTATMTDDDSGDGKVTVADPGEYVVDPSPAVTRAGLVRRLAADLGGWQIDPRIAFLSADAPPSTPFGRSLRVEASLPFSVKALAAELRRLDVGTVDIRRRGLAGDVDELRRRLRPQGTRRAVVLLTRVRDRPWTMVCTDLEPS